jgi:hypothetical protein
MSLRRVVGLAAIAPATLLWLSCGQVYRPVVIPTTTTPPNPANFHAVFGVSANVPFNPGTAMQIDVSGDTDIGVANMGYNPTHAAILPNNSRIFVANAGSLYQGDADVVMAFTPASAFTGSGLGTPVTFSLPNFGPIDITTGKPQWTCSYLPDFIATTQNTAVYVANYGVDNAASCNPNLASTDSVAVLNASTNVVNNIGYLPAGSHPVALVETPNGQNLYVANQGDGSVTDLSPVDLSPLTTIAIGKWPTWAVSRPDSQRVYVVTQGDGLLHTIRTDTNAEILPPQFVGGPGANYVLYDKSRNRLYATNPSAGSVYVFDATADPPALLGAISMTAGANPPCQDQNHNPVQCAPVSVAALPDGSRFYVASYESETECPDANVVNSDGTPAPCVIPRLTVFDALSLAVKVPVSSLLPPSLSLLAQPPFPATQYAAPLVPSCAAVVPYAPGATRFRMFTTTAADSSHVYVSLCDARSIADVVTTTSSISTGSNSADVLVTDLNPAFAFSAGATITSFAISSNVVTFQAANSFYAGENVVIQNLTAGTYLDGLTLTVLGTGLTQSQFACAFAHADVSQTSDSGTATPVSSAVPQTPIFLLTGQ